MKRFIAISFLFIYAFSTSELHELAKLPLLFSHYQLHKTWDSRVTFLEFLVHHYTESIDHNPDYDLDRQLPFKSDAGHTPLHVWFVPSTAPPSYVFRPIPCYRSEEDSFDYRNGKFLSSYFSSIWQPPRNC